MKTECDTGQIAEHIYSDLCKCKADDMIKELKELREKVGIVLILCGDTFNTREESLKMIQKVFLGDKT